MTTQKVATPKELKERWEKKKNQIETLSSNIDRLRRHVSEDLKSDKEKDFLTALAIALIDKTGERVGNDTSANNGNFGITVLRKKHIKIDGDTVALTYRGKSGVLHETSFSSSKLSDALKKAIKNSKGIRVFQTSEGFRIKNDGVNRYLKNYDISAKDIRGYRSNDWIIKRLSREAIPQSKEQRTKMFSGVLKKVAAKIGHGKATLRNHYMIPEIETSYINDGIIIDISDKEKYEAGGRSQEAGDRRQETGVRRQETGGRKYPKGHKQEAGQKGKKINITSDGTKGGLLYGATDKGNGKGINAEVIGGDKVILGGGEIIINEQAAKENCELLNEINTSTGGREINCNLQQNANTGKMNNGGNIENKITKKQIQNVISGKSKVRHGEAIQAAANYIKEVKGAIRESKESNQYKHQEEKLLKDYINKNSLWIELDTPTSDYFNRGAEQRVYFSPSVNVIKLNGARFYDSWEGYFHSLILHNYFFPDTSYTLMGFTQDKGELYAVVNQLAVDTVEKTDLNDVKKIMNENGFIVKKNNDYYNEELGILLEDLHDENVLTKDGLLYFIDTVFYLYPEGYESDNEMNGGGSVNKSIPVAAFEMPRRKIYDFAKKIKQHHPEIWKLGGNIAGNDSFKKLERVIRRGYWIESERPFYIQWQAWMARHKGDFLIAGVVANLKWLSEVDKGWDYMKELTQAEIEKRYSKYDKMTNGGNVKNAMDNHSIEEFNELIWNLKTEAKKAAESKDVQKSNTLRSLISRVVEQRNEIYFNDGGEIPDLLKTINQEIVEGDFILPKEHKPFMKVASGGSSCANCKFMTEVNSGYICNNKYYQKWQGTDELPDDVGNYCSDWWEGK